MKKIIVSAFIMLVLSFNANSQIEGNVLDTAGKYIADVIIIAMDSVNNVSDTVKSDKTGYFIYKKLKKGEYNITAKVPGFQSATYQNITVNNEFDDRKSGDDISNATWLEIILQRPKGPK